MMRICLALGGALALAGCVAGDKVTLLTPAQEGKRANGEVGSVAVLEEDGSETVLDTVNQQARLSNRGARLRQLDAPDPLHAELIGNLPAPIAREVFMFGTGQSRLTGEQLERLQTRMPMHLSRPDPQIEIAAYTDVIGSEADNNALSQRRATSVAQQLRELGFTVEAEDVVARGEYAAQRAPKGQRGEPDENFRVVVVIVR